jgi:PTS system cellobiose-specific IIC component
MSTVMTWLNEGFAPRVNKITRNPYVAGLQDGLLRIVPFILVGSLVTLVAIIPGVADAVPSIWKLSDYTFGLISLFLSYLIAFFILEKKKRADVSQAGGLAALALYLMLLMPVDIADSDPALTGFDFSRFGAKGMFVAVLAGIFAAVVMDFFGRIDLFKNATGVPSFVVNWFKSLLPITIVLTVGWLLTFVLGFNVFDLVLDAFSPLMKGADTYPGFVLMCFVSAFLYSLGISTWALAPLFYPLWLQNIQLNSEQVAAGNAATHINTYETVFSGWIAIGGVGATLGLAFLMAFTARSSRLRVIGRAGLVPSIFNINEPIIFGGPVAFNPILMVPMWLQGLVLPAIVYPVLASGLVTVPGRVFSLWYVPFPISTYVISGIAGAILATLLIALSTLIWLPFMRVYDRQEVTKEKAEAARADASPRAAEIAATAKTQTASGTTGDDSVRVRRTRPRVTTSAHQDPQ